MKSSSLTDFLIQGAKTSERESIFDFVVTNKDKPKARIRTNEQFFKDLYPAGIPTPIPTLCLSASGNFREDTGDLATVLLGFDYRGALPNVITTSDEFKTFTPEKVVNTMEFLQATANHYYNSLFLFELGPLGAYKYPSINFQLNINVPILNALTSGTKVVNYNNFDLYGIEVEKGVTLTENYTYAETIEYEGLAFIKKVVSNTNFTFEFAAIKKVHVLKAVDTKTV